MRRGLVVMVAVLACLVPTTGAVAAAPAPTVTAGLLPGGSVTAGTARTYAATFVVTRLTAVRYSVGVPAGFSKPTATQLPLPTGCTKATGPMVAADGPGWSITGTLTCKNLALFALAFKTTGTTAGASSFPWRVESSTDSTQGRSGSFPVTVVPAALAAVSVLTTNPGLPANGTSTAKLIASPVDAYGNVVTATLVGKVLFDGGGSTPGLSAFGSAKTATYLASTTPGVSTITVKATQGSKSVTSAPVTITQVARFSVRTDGEIVSFFDNGSFREGTPVLSGAGAIGIHLSWTAPQDINLAGNSDAERSDLVLTLPFGEADFLGVGDYDRYQVWNGTNVGGTCHLPLPLAYAATDTTTLITFPTPQCHAGQTLDLDLVAVGFSDPRSFRVDLKLPHIPVPQNPLDIADAVTVTPVAPSHTLVLGTPQPVAGDPFSRDVEITIEDAPGHVETDATTGVEVALGRCGEVGHDGLGWQPAPDVEAGRTTVRITSSEAHTGTDLDGVDHPVWTRDFWYFRTTDTRSPLAGAQVELGDPTAPGAVEFAMSETPGYECPGHSKW